MPSGSREGSQKESAKRSGKGSTFDTLDLPKVDEGSQNLESRGHRKKGAQRLSKASFLKDIRAARSPKMCTNKSSWRYVVGIVVPPQPPPPGKRHFWRLCTQFPDKDPHAPDDPKRDGGLSHCPNIAAVKAVYREVQCHCCIKGPSWGI